jgi:hypothetical protein
MRKWFAKAAVPTLLTVTLSAVASTSDDGWTIFEDDAVPDSKALWYIGKLLSSGLADTESNHVLFEFMVAKLVVNGGADEATARQTGAYLADLYDQWMS